jgi:hypothetical protein
MQNVKTLKVAAMAGRIRKLFLLLASDFPMGAGAAGLQNSSRSGRLLLAALDVCQMEICLSALNPPEPPETGTSDPHPTQEELARASFRFRSRRQQYG